MPQRAHIRSNFERALLHGLSNNLGTAGRQGFAILATLLSLCIPASAQWATMVPLTADPLGYEVAGGMVMDNDWHLHVFGIRDMPVGSHHVQGRGLIYLRYDNWGNLLGTPTVVAPSDTTYSDQPPAVMLDRDGFVRAIWGRNRYAEPANLGRILYVRISPAGEVVDGPRELDQGDLVPHYVPVHSDMVQGPDRRIYFVDDGRLAIFDANMHAVTPFHAFVPETSLTFHPVPSISPEGQVWIAFRCVIGFGIQQVAMLRVDTLGAMRDTVVLGANIDENVGSESFFIDSAGVFHYIISRDLTGLSYLRDARNGSPPDTLVLDAHPWYGGETPLRQVGGDSLMVLMEGGDPPFHRFVFNLQGHRLLTQAFNNPNFSTGGWTSHVYQNGSHWILGTCQDAQRRYQLAVIHVPGPNEPPNSVNPNFGPRPSFLILSAYPNPFNSTTRISFSLPKAGRGELCVYDITGRLVTTLADRKFDAGEHEMTFDGKGLGSGIYFVRMQAGETSKVEKMVLLK